MSLRGTETSNHWRRTAMGQGQVRSGRVRVLRAVPVALLLATLLVSCQTSERRLGNAQAPTRAIAVVNNEKILYEDFQNAYQLFLTQWDRFIQNDPNKRLEIKELLLQSKIEERLLAQEARRKGIEISSTELETRMNDIFLNGGENEPASAEGYIPPQQLEEWQAQFKERLIIEKLVNQEVTEKIRLSTAELRRYYQQNREQFMQPERVRVRHIAVGSRSLFNRVMDQLEGRAPFVRMVRRYSITPDRMDDGDLGYVERGILPREFDEAIFDMSRVGSITSRRDPVKTQMGYHIFKLEGRESAGLLSYNKALPDLRTRLVREKKEEAYQRWLKRLRERSTIHIDDALLNVE